MTIINGQYREYALDNGLVVALQNTPTQTIVGELIVNYAAYHERKEEEGLAHFLEHCLVTGGSKKYTPKTADYIRNSLGYANAATQIGRTIFMAKMLSEDIETWLDYISDHTFKPRFDQKRIEGERGRVLREIADAKSNSSYLVNKEFRELFYENHPKGIFVLGRDDKIIKNSDRQKIKKFYSRGFYPNNMALILAGNLPKNIERLIRVSFGSAKPGKDTRVKFPKANTLKGKKIVRRYVPEIRNEENPEESSAQILLACNNFPVELSPEEYSIYTMNYIFGGNSSSPLFENIGLKKGLAYDIRISYDGFYNFGEWLITAKVPAKRIEEATDSIFNEIDKMKKIRVSEDVLNSTKKSARYGIAEEFESNKGHIDAIGRKLDYGITPTDMQDKFDKVTTKDVQEVANKYLPDKENGDYLLYIADPLTKPTNSQSSR